MMSQDGAYDGDDAAEYSEPRDDIEGLLEYFEGLKDMGVRLTEVMYVVNSWTLGGVIPLWHHGFIVKAEDTGYLTLDFSRRGILWDTFEMYPDVPDGTLFAKKYLINVDPDIIKSYCKNTKPFSWPNNDCQNWAKGMMKVMNITEDPMDDPLSFRKAGKDKVDCFACGANRSDNMSLGRCLN